METIVQTEPVPPTTEGGNEFDKMSDEQKALVTFKYFTNKFTQALLEYDGSRQQLKRAWANANIAPLNEHELHFSYDKEEDLFNLFTEANSAKLMLMVHGLAKEGAITINRSLLDKPTTMKTEEKTNG